MSAHNNVQSVLLAYYIDVLHANFAEPTNNYLNQVLSNITQVEISASSYRQTMIVNRRNIHSNPKLSRQSKKWPS